MFINLQIFTICVILDIILTGRSAFIGVGFLDRSDSFDLNVALQDHFKWLKKSEEIEKEKVEPKQELDLRFKEGETIKINMKITVSIIFFSRLNIMWWFKCNGTDLF